MALAFDTLKYAKTLEKAGLERQQAEGIANAHIDALRAVIKDNLSNQADIEKINNELKLDIALVNQNIEALRQETKTDIALIRKDIEALRKDFKIQILVAMGSMSVFLTGVIGVATAVILHVVK